MKDISFFQEVPLSSFNFVNNLKFEKEFNFYPSPKNNTSNGKKLNMGFNCYALKLSKISNDWNKKNEIEKTKWIEYLNSYQLHEFKEYQNYFIDPKLYEYFNGYLTKFKFKEIAKSTFANFTNKSYESTNSFIYKTIMADNKQTMSTLKELGYNLNKRFEFNLNNLDSVSEYLNQYDWSKPWDAGAQFSSLSVYSNILDLKYETELIKYINSKVDLVTGSYFDQMPKNSRQIINGAMKVISGLDWIDSPIHYPEKLIDFCLNNKPVFEGCDLVDYIYVLYKCSNETNYKRSEINLVVLEILQSFKELFFENWNGFSYYFKKSQTHYYGIEITKGKNYPDLHGTLLANWAIVMILEILEQNKYEFKTIKP